MSRIANHVAVSFVTLMFLFSAYLYAGVATDYYVIADIANIRQKPELDAPIIGKVRIGNRLSTSRTSGKWLFIDTVYLSDNGNFSKEYRHYPIKGWIYRSSCDGNKIDKDYLSMMLNKSETLEDSIKWLERLAAFDPGDRKVLETLHRGYTAAGDSVKATAIGVRLRGTDPVYIAAGDGDRIYLLGVIDSVGDFRSLQWVEGPTQYDQSTPLREGWRCANSDCEGKRREAHQVRTWIGGALWYRYGYTDSWVQTVQFPTPGTEPFDSDNPDLDRPTPGPKVDNVDETDIFRIVLGKNKWFDEYPYTRSLFATKKIYPVATQGLNNTSEYESLNKWSRQLVGQTLDSAGALGYYYGSLKEYGCKDIVVWGWSRDMYRIPYILWQRGVFDQKKACIWPPRIHQDERAQTPEKSVLDLSKAWFRFGPDSSFPAYTIGRFGMAARRCENCNGDRGADLIRVTKKDTRIFNIISQYYGD